MNIPNLRFHRIHQDANVFVSEFDKDNVMTFELKPNRQAYFLCIEGKVDINGKETLEARDALEVRALIEPLSFKAQENSHLLAIEMAVL